MKIMSIVAPPWERGLKLLALLLGGVLGLSRSPLGAWIEIHLSPDKIITLCSRSPLGAWIEILTA